MEIAIKTIATNIDAKIVICCDDRFLSPTKLSELNMLPSIPIRVEIMGAHFAVLKLLRLELFVSSFLFSMTFYNLVANDKFTGSRIYWRSGETPC